MDEHKHATEQHAKNHCFSNENVPEHHSQILAKHKQNHWVNKVTEETHMSEMASKHIMYVAPVDSIHTESEVIHESESVMWRPNTVQKVE